MLKVNDSVMYRRFTDLDAMTSRVGKVIARHGNSLTVAFGVNHRQDHVREFVGVDRVRKNDRVEVKRRLDRDYGSQFNVARVRGNRIWITKHTGACRVLDLRSVKKVPAIGAKPRGLREGDRVEVIEPDHSYFGYRLKVVAVRCDDVELITPADSIVVIDARKLRRI